MELHWVLVTFGDCHLVTSPLSCVALLSAVEIQQVFTWEGATYIFVKKDRKITKIFFPSACGEEAGDIQAKE